MRTSDAPILRTRNHYPHRHLDQRACWQSPQPFQSPVVVKSVEVNRGRKQDSSADRHAILTHIVNEGRFGDASGVQQFLELCWTIRILVPVGIRLQSEVQEIDHVQEIVNVIDVRVCGVRGCPDFRSSQATRFPLKNKTPETDPVPSSLPSNRPSCRSTDYSSPANSSIQALT